MTRKIVTAVLLIALGAIGATMANWLSVPAEDAAPGVLARGAGAKRDEGSDTARRLRDLETRLSRETSARQQAETQLTEMQRKFAALLDGRESLPVRANRGANAAASAAPPPAAPPPEAVAAAPAEPPPPEVDYSKSEMERALIAGGLDPNTAADVKRKSDQLQLAQIYLRDQATREGWVDTPRYQEETATLEAQQVSIRDELGEEGYDRYLFSLGQTNRVRVDDVMSGSPAADAGLEVGDMILRYGDTRVFRPDELVAQTTAGQPGEMVRLVVIRQGNLISVDVPRGPLGLRINAAQSMPNSG
jgi:hypothetical protein